MIKDNDKKRVLYVITKSNWGGAQRYVYDLATNLPKSKFEVSVALGGNGELISKLEIAGIKTIQIKNLERDISLGKELKSFLELYKIIKKERPDILHINSSKAGGLGTLAGRLVGTPFIIFTAHAWAFNENRNTLSKSIIKLAHWITIILSHKTITVSEAVRKQMLGAPFVRNKMVTVHLGINPPAFIGRNDARKKLNIPEKAFAIGTIAELHPVKGIEYALNAIKELRLEANYTIIGEGGDKEKLEKYIGEDTKLHQSVKLTGFIQDAAKLLKAFDVFLLPSISEALGYVLLEASYAEVPIVASSVGGIKEIVEDGKTGVLVRPENPIDIRNAVEKMFSNEEFRKSCVKSSLGKIKKEFNLNSMLDKTIDLYMSGSQ